MMNIPQNFAWWEKNPTSLENCPPTVCEVGFFPTKIFYQIYPWRHFYLRKHIWKCLYYEIFKLSLNILCISHVQNTVNPKHYMHLIGLCFVAFCCGLLSVNYANTVYAVATIYHQVRWLCWGHPSKKSFIQPRLFQFHIKCFAWEIYHADLYGWIL